MAYLFTFFSGLMLAIASGKSGRFFYLYLLILFLLAAFRFGIGPDYFAYEDLFLALNTDLLAQLSAITGREMLFKVIGTVSGLLGLSYQQYSAIFAFVSLLFIGKLAREYSPYPVATLFLYFCFFYFVWVFSGIRQGLTLAVGTYYLLSCLEDRRTLKMLIIVVILTAVHASSLILLVFYAVGTMNLNRTTMMSIVLASVFISLIPAAYMMEVVRLLPGSARIEFYYRPEFVSTNSIFDFKSVARLILLLLFGVLFVRHARQNLLHKQILNLYLFSFVVYFCFRFVEILGSNASIYGFVLIVLIIPIVYDQLNDRVNRTVIFVSCFILSIGFYSKTLSSMIAYSAERKVDPLIARSDWKIVAPYPNIFNGEAYFADKTP